MKTKKSTLLSLATAAAIVATTFGTYAVWDTLNVTSGVQEVTINSPVSMQISPTEFALVSRELGAVLPEYTSTATVNVQNVPDDQTSNYKLAVSAKAYKDEAMTTPVTDEVTVEADPKSTAATNGDHAITVKVTPKEDSTVAGKYYVTVTAEIVKNNP